MNRSTSWLAQTTWGARSSGNRLLRWRHAAAWLLVVLAFVTGACKAEERPPPPSAEATKSTSGKAPGEAGKPRRGPGSVQRKLVRDAELSIEVTSYQTARSAIERQLSSVDGYVESADVVHRDDKVSSATLSLRIPADQLDAFVASCAKLGTVLEESLRARDVTEEYYDAEARVLNARKLESRLLELLQTQTHDVKDLLEVERELGRVRERIETIEGQLRLLDSQVALSKLVVKLTTQDRFSAGKPSTLTGRIRRTLAGSWSGLVSAGQALVLLITALLPWSPIIGGLGYFLIRWYRRHQTSLMARRAATGVYPVAPTHYQDVGAYPQHSSAHQSPWPQASQGQPYEPNPPVPIAEPKAPPTETLEANVTAPGEEPK